MKPSLPLTASWIWTRQESYVPYHQVILARKDFRLVQPGPATLRIAVDGSYRLFINGEWVADGPARSWPEAFQYDEIDVTAYLLAGHNELAVIARHWQVGDFHNRPQQAGLLVQLDVQPLGGPAKRVSSNASWAAAWLPAWAGDTPKVSIQMEPQELYEAPLEAGVQFSPAAVLYPAYGGPWQGLHARDVALLNRKLLPLRAFLGANLVKRKTDLDFCLPAVRLAHPGLVEANRFTSASRGMATLLDLAEPANLRLACNGMLAAIDGSPALDGSWTLPTGRHLLLAFTWPVFSHQKERSLRIVDPPARLSLVNPLDPAFANPWCDIGLPEFNHAEDDLVWDWFSGPDHQRDALVENYREKTAAWLSTLKDAAALQHVPGWQPRNLPAVEMFVRDTHWAFTSREVVGSRSEAAALVQNPAALMQDNAALTTVHPSPQGDVELVYDLGEQSVGYFDLDLVAPAGVQIDVFAVEYISPDNRIQHTGDNRNGLRLVTRAGRNRFTSLKRRAGRYLFITIRNQAELVSLEGGGKDPSIPQPTWAPCPGAGLPPQGGKREGFKTLFDGMAIEKGQKKISPSLEGGPAPEALAQVGRGWVNIPPVQFRLVRMIESTYPVEQRAFFTSSDARLEQIWDISARTLKLCMEDTFTDCPLYEQTHWVGDARNEAIFALDTFGATDIALRCLRLTAQSLNRYPIAGGQVPSGWDMLLPAWSFLWGIAVWDYYFHTADQAALRELWPAVVRNLQGAEALLDASGLFSGKFWNMFDWTGVDDHHETVLHNSLLMIGAVAAAQKMAAVLGSAAPQADWLADLRARLVAAVNRCWDPARQAYPDSLHADGSPSPSTCQHTSFLALLYDVVPLEQPDMRAAALRNTLAPPAGMVRVGSPFASMYLYEALEKEGRLAEILASIYANYLPMLAEGATTVWEVFPTSGDRPQGFPTRSHTHAWSSAPLHFLPRVVLGIRQTAPGGAAYEISPWVAGLEWAHGAINTATGLLEVSWRREGSTLLITVKAPPQVEVRFERNESMQTLQPRFERLENEPLPHPAN